MHAKIVGESEEGIGADVVDNNGAAHEITFERGTWEIVYHQCDAYADKASNRTQEENEYNEQARRYARYYVYQEQGYDIVEHTENPAYIDAVRKAIARFSDEEFEEYFGALYQQLRSHHDSADRLVEIPAGARDEDAVVYELDVYLGLDVADSTVADTAEAIADADGLEFETATEQTVTDVSERDLDDWTAVGEELREASGESDVPVTVAGVSGIHVGYPNALGEHEVQAAEDPFDREADARIELLPADPGTLEAFRTQLDHHLRSQVRDCFAGMGLFPPEPFQTVGFGKVIYARRYDQYDLYPRFHMTDETTNTFLR